MKDFQYCLKRGFKNHRRRVEPLAENPMMTEPDLGQAGLSMEAIPSGRSMPNWLVQSLLEGRRLMVIHPSEDSRQQAIESLHSRGEGLAIDTTHHLTIKRLIGILHLDLRLPVLLEDDGVLFEKTHRALAKAAANYEFPLLMTNPQHRWTRSRSRRLLSLYRELITLRRPWAWQEDIEILGKRNASNTPLQARKSRLGSDA